MSETAQQSFTSAAVAYEFGFMQPVTDPKCKGLMCYQVWRSGCKVGF